MRKKFVLLIFNVFFISINCALLSQTPDASSVNVSSLSDSQVEKLIAEIQTRGLTESQAITLAKAKGLSDTQISQLKQRMQEVKMGTSSSPSYTSDSISSTDSADELSTKQNLHNEKTDKTIFGFSFFNSKNLTFDPNINIPVPSTYVIGSGDELLIDVYGASQMSYKLTVDRNGYIDIPDVGPINIGGITQKEAKIRILNKLVLIYKDLKSNKPRTFTNISLGSIKSIKVNVIGEVFIPGTYTLPGTATAFNALYLAGGPNKKGSFRSIQIIRDGKVFKQLDVYDYLINGNSAENIQLVNGDVILVPTYKKRIVVEGEFKRDGIYEATEDETVNDIIQYAGGFNENAYRNRIELERYTSKEKEFKDVYDKDYKSVVLHNGDKITAGVVLDRFTNRVVINGAVYRPGSYELTDSLTLSQLIINADGVKENAFLNRGLITRLDDNFELENINFNVRDILSHKEDILLKEDDVITISSIGDLKENQIIDVKGVVLHPGTFDYEKNMTLGDVIFKAGGFKESASNSVIEITRRLNHEEAKTYGDAIAHVYQFSVPRDLKLDAKDEGFVLQPFDQVFIRKAPGYKSRSNVKISGEVLYEGDYSIISMKEKLSDYITRAGGLTPDAFPRGAILTREIKDSKALKEQKELLANVEGTDVVKEESDRLVVGINLEKIIANPGGKNDIYLQDGDELHIPRELQTVKINGGVLNPIATTLNIGKNLKYYVDQGGGLSTRAIRRKIYVIYPNGIASSTKSFLFFRNYPKIIAGSEIYVPEKTEREPMSASAWIGIGSALASLSLTIVTIVNKID